MQQTQNEVIEKCKRFFKRCVLNPEYRVLLFLNDNEKLQYFKHIIFPEIITGKEDMTSIFCVNNNIELRCQNGSKFTIAVIDSGHCGTRANVLIVDSDIKESVLKEVAESCICSYKYAGVEMINPKPIYIKLSLEKEDGCD